MIYLVHGSDYAQTRKLIVSQQKKLGAAAKIEMNIDEITPIKLMETVSTFDIFGNPPFVVLNVSEAKNKEYDEYVDLLINMPEETTVIIQSSKVLGQTHAFMKNARKLKAKVAQTDIEAKGNIFRFVDNLFFKNRQSAYKELQMLLNEGKDTFYILSMILYGLRTVAHAKFCSASFSKKSGFIKSKAGKQARGFSENSILNLYKDAYQTEKDLKTGDIAPEIALAHIIEKVLV